MPVDKVNEMTCDEVRPRLGAHIDGELPATAIAVKVRLDRFQSSRRCGATRLSFCVCAELASIRVTRRSGFG